MTTRTPTDMKKQASKKVKGLGRAPAQKQPGRSTAPVPSPKKAQGTPPPTSSEEKKLERFKKNLFAAFDVELDIGWSLFAITELQKRLQDPAADVPAIAKNIRYHLRAIVRNKGKLGYDTTKDAKALADFNAIGIAAAPRSAKARGVQRKARAGNPESPKPSKT